MDDRDLVQLPETKTLRARIAMQLSIFRSTLDVQRLPMPSYMRASVIRVLEDFDRWTADERTPCVGDSER